MILFNQRTYLGVVEKVTLSMKKLPFIFCKNKLALKVGFVPRKASICVS